MKRLRFVLTTAPRVNPRFKRAPDTTVSFAPMDALADGLGGLAELETKPFSEVASGSYNYFENGDVLLAKVTPCFENGKKAIARDLENGAGFATSEVFVFRPDCDGIDTRYLHYLFCSEDFRHKAIASMTGAGGLRRVSERAVLDFPLRITDSATQRQIADFLDRETARIDLLIEKKQRLVALLAGKRETVRDTAVCKGLSNTAEIKDSGVDWFGDVPTHWTVCRFNRLIASKVDYRGRTPEKVDEGVFLVTARNIRDGRIDYNRSQEYTTAEDWGKLSARGKPSLGEVIFTTEAPLGQIAQVDRTDVAFAQRIMKFGANIELVSNDFLTQFMMSASFQRSLQLYSSGSTAAGIKSERLAHLFGLVPPKTEQEEIVHYIRSEIDRLDALETPINASIVRIKEYRSALITAAVTGQIDVTTYAKSGTPDHRLDAIQEEMEA